MSLGPTLRTAPAGWSDETRIAPVTTTQLVRYAGASGDFNPIHFDHFHAVEAKLGGVIAHGMLTMAFMGRALTDRIGPDGRVAGLSARFTAPVRPGDAVSVLVTVTARREGPGDALEVDCGLEAKVAERQVAVGTATLAWGPAGAGQRAGAGPEAETGGQDG